MHLSRVVASKCSSYRMLQFKRILPAINLQSIQLAQLKYQPMMLSQKTPHLFARNFSSSEENPNDSIENPAPAVEKKKKGRRPGTKKQKQEVKVEEAQEPIEMYTLKFNSPILPYAKFPLT